MNPGIPVLLVAAMLGACAHAPRARAANDDARREGMAPAAGAAAIDVQRDIVLAVDNPVIPPTPHAGSNVLGYGTMATYRNGQRAMATLAELERRHGLREIVGWTIEPLGLYCAVVRPAPGADRDALLEALSRSDRVRIAEPVREYALYAGQSAAVRYNDPYVGLQRGFAEIDAALAQRASLGAGVEVALVDTGVDTGHPDLEGRIRGVHDMVDAAGTRDGDRHGTEVAGVIAAVGDNQLGIVGVAPEATLRVYRACWHPPGRPAARCNTFTLAKALAAIIGADARIINMSLGGPRDPLLEQLLVALLEQDRIIVAAMPPDGRTEGFPAGVPGVILVGTAQVPGAPAGVLSAPGVDILTTQPGGHYDFASGSSLAAAHVTGISALLLSLSPDISASEVRRILQRSSTMPEGNRVVNAAAAVEAVADARTAATRPSR